MKKLFVLPVLAVLAVAGVKIAADHAFAANAAETQFAVTQDCASGSASAVTAGAAPVTAAMSARDVASMSYPPVAAVSCGSDQWCCKHDIGGTGACTRCCNK